MDIARGDSFDNFDDFVLGFGMHAGGFLPNVWVTTGGPWKVGWRGNLACIHEFIVRTSWLGYRGRTPGTDGCGIFR